jgi:hypothetical protein
MKKPWVVGILSIIPGLGLIILGKIIPGILAMASLIVLAFPILFGPSGAASEGVVAVVLIIWVVQGYYAVVVAQRSARAAAGESLPERAVSIDPPPPRASLAEKRAYEASKAVLQVLPPGSTPAKPAHRPEILREGRV